MLIYCHFWGYINGILIFKPTCNTFAFEHSAPARWPWRQWRSPCLWPPHACHSIPRNLHRAANPWHFKDRPNAGIAVSYLCRYLWITAIPSLHIIEICTPSTLHIHHIHTCIYTYRTHIPDPYPSNSAWQCRRTAIPRRGGLTGPCLHPWTQILQLRKQCLTTEWQVSNLTSPKLSERDVVGAQKSTFLEVQRFFSYHIWSYVFKSMIPIDIHKVRIPKPTIVLLLNNSYFQSISV